MAENATVVLVHGAAAGSWTWHLVVDGLSERGIDVRTVDLPSCSAPDASIDAHDDARYVRAILDDIASPIVLVANSYGGVVISEAAVDHPRVVRLVYISAIMSNANQSIADLMAGVSSGLTDAVHILGDGRIVFDPEIDMQASFQHAPAEEQTFIAPHLGRPMSMGLDLDLSLPKVAWTTIPSTYVVCADDQALPPEVQRAWAKENATEAIEWPTDHSPQHSAPGLVVDLLAKLATA